ncbi:hypothetical protein ACIBAG_40015 [Streptomyces sp. NPDC051243]|uniref:hypothetical protein n=1 Tax=Streptomyces sp. NPDC051243 TaxID=3365646 RepID=UPI00379FBB2C
MPNMNHWLSSGRYFSNAARSRTVDQRDGEDQGDLVPEVDRHGAGVEDRDEAVEAGEAGEPGEVDPEELLRVHQQRHKARRPERLGEGDVVQVVRTRLGLVREGEPAAVRHRREGEDGDGERLEAAQDTLPVREAEDSAEEEGGQVGQCAAEAVVRRLPEEVEDALPGASPSGGVALLESANSHDVQVSTVNIMTMNYGESYTGDMGDYALTSAKATHAQLKEIFGTADATAWNAMALTSMLGVNDVDGETFTLEDAAQVREFAEEKGVGWVSMWATFRDQQCGEDSEDDALTNCSGVDQADGAFAVAFSG